MKKVISIALLTLVLVNTFANINKPQENTDIQARVMVWQAVEARLTSPSTADFSFLRMTKTGTGSWSTRGYVDSQNAFGATMRNHFYCEVKYVSESQWKLIELTFR